MRLYPRLALSALRRNGRLYVPYLLSCVGMTALFYIIRLLSLSPLLGANTTMIISMGTVVIAAIPTPFSCAAATGSSAFTTSSGWTGAASAASSPGRAC